MELTANEVAKRIPDFDDLVELTENIGNLLLKKMLLEKDIRNLETKTVLRIISNPDFNVSGKPPSMSFIDATWKYNGIDNEILPLREKLAETYAELEKAKSRYDLYKELISIWQTLTYAERKNTL
jgi:hypothetical protein